MPVVLTDVEREVLAVFVAEKDAWLNCFYPGIVDACKGDFDRAEAICRNLRKRKLIDGEGRGKFAQYGANEKTGAFA